MPFVAKKREAPTSVRLDPEMQARLKHIQEVEGGRSLVSVLKQAIQEFIERWEANRRTNRVKLTRGSKRALRKMADTIEKVVGGKK